MTEEDDVIHIPVPSGKARIPRPGKSLMPGASMLDLQSDFVEVTISAKGDRVWIITKEHGTAFRVQLNRGGTLMLDDCRTGVMSTHSPQHLRRSPLCPNCGEEMKSYALRTWTCDSCTVVDMTGRRRLREGKKDE